ncbi:transient receptor potential channel pyrexia-like [Hetaerina americana]|uniref:transient receptor potential channel pyrexia-like n=1 Tax=Hetaerina americana TaxID=62018 RepID=UPI003A7F5AE0
MDEVTSRVLGELRGRGRNPSDGVNSAFAEETIPFMDEENGGSHIPYPDPENVATPVRCEGEPKGFVWTEDEAGRNPRRSGILFSSLQRRTNSLNDDRDGFALLQAIVQGNTEEAYKWISWHLSKGSLIKLRFGISRETALIIASSGSNLGIINALLSAGVDPNEADWFGRTPLLVATASGRHEHVKALLQKSANPNLSYKKSDKTKTSECQEDNEWRKIEEEYFCEKISLPDISIEGYTPLHLAAQTNNLECLNLLLESKADPNAMDNNNLTPIMLAGEGLDAEDHDAIIAYEKIIEAFLRERAYLKVTGVETTGNTVLHRAAELDAKNALSLLLKNGCDPNQCENDLTPLHVAIQTAVKSCAPDPSCLSILLNYGADLSQENEQGHSALKIIMTQISRPKKFLYSVLDRQINLTNEACDSGKEVNVNFQAVSPGNHDQQERVLYALLEEESISRWIRYDLFRHPLLKAFVIRKWSRLKKFFYVYVGVYLIHVLSLSAFVTLAHSDVFNLFGGGWRNAIIQEGIPISKFFVIATSILVLVNILWMCYVFPNRYPCSFEAIRNIVGSALSIAVSVLTVYDGDSYSFIARLSTANFLDNRESIEPSSASDDSAVLADGSNFELSYTQETPILMGEDSLNQRTDSSSIQSIVNHCTAIAIFQAWLDLMLLMGRFPWASDALLFTAVLKNVLRVLATYGYMIAGFAFVFFLEFREVNIFAFGDPWRALLKTMVMMMGEYDYMETFADDKDNLVQVANKLPIYIQVIFLGFIVIASIALMNLMLGLAVSDTQELAEESSQRQLMKLAESVVHWGSAVFALERLCHKYPRIKDWFKKCRIIPIELKFPINFTETVLPRQIMKELSEIAMKNQDLKQKHEKGMESPKKSNIPRKVQPNTSRGSAAFAPKTSAHISEYSEKSDDKEIIGNLRIDIAELRQELAEIKELLENYFHGNDHHSPIIRNNQSNDSTHNTRKFRSLLYHSIRKRRGNVAVPEK